MSLLVDDVRHAVRALRQQRALSVVISITVVLAIGANSAIFTVVNAVMLRPLPYDDPDRVVMLSMVDRTGADQLLSVPDYEDLRATLHHITGLSLMGTQTANLTGVAEPDRLRAGFVTADFFTMLGVQPIMGRGFAPGEDARGAAKTAVLDYDAWRTRFGSDPSVVGRSLTLNNEPHEVIGILPPRFEFPLAESEVWLPYSSLPIQDRGRGSRNWLVFGRVSQDVSYAQAQAELDQASAALATTYPETNANWTARVPRPARIERGGRQPKPPAADGRRRLRPADRVRQHRQSSARPCLRTSARDCRAGGARRIQGAYRASAAD